MVFVGVFAIAISVPADGFETGWRKQGVRVWYVGKTAASSTSSATETYKIHSLKANSAMVAKHAGNGNWQFTQPTQNLRVANPVSEGPFWINPSRLANVRPADAVTWQGTRCLVKSVGTYTAANHPWVQPSLVMDALLALRAKRKMVTLSGESGGVGLIYNFDCETGLMFLKHEAAPGIVTFFALSEINYDFARNKVLNEDSGPHSGFSFNCVSGNFFWGVGGCTMGIAVEILSRHGNSIISEYNANFSTTLSSLPESFHSYYKTVPGKGTFIKPTTGGKWKRNGDHLFFWIPPADRSRNRIEVWNHTLERKGINSSGQTVFAAVGNPLTYAFPEIRMSSRGWATDFVVSSAQPWFFVDTALDPTNSNPITINGLSYYLNHMKGN